MKFYNPVGWRGNLEQKQKYNCCELCNKQPFTPYMVKSHLWPKEHKFLCLNCLQNFIGREITIEDFTSCQFTNLIKLGYLLGKNQTKIDLSEF